MAKNKRPGIVVRLIPGKKGMWEVYATHNPKSPFNSFTSIKGAHHSGNYEFGTRLVVKNGSVICGNRTQFNKLSGAVKNIRSVQNSC